MELAGKLLIAPPNVRGNFWQKTVIFITEDHDRGSMGLVVNKPSKLSIREFANQVGVDADVDGYMHIGGPVNVKALSMLHSAEWNCGNTMQINKEFAISSSPDLLERLAMGDSPHHWRLFVGLCAWAPDQLNNEMKGVHPYNHDFSWLVATPHYNSVFGLNTQDLWTASIEQSSEEFVQSLLA